jgi:hypothetical protein
MRSFQLRPILLALVLGLAAASGANALRTSPLPLCSTSCTVWSPCEINLSTTGSTISEVDLYRERLKATLTQTSGGTDSRVVPGFYFDRPSYGNGLATFKIRFTPVSAGTYHYSTSSSLAGLDGQFSDFTCSAAVSLADGETNPGFLRRDASNPYSFVWDNSSLSVTHPFLWGETYYQIVNQARRNSDSDATWHTAVDNAKASKMKKIRLLVAPWNEVPFSDATHSKLTEPFCTGASSSACEVANGTLDFTRVDLDHYVALDKVVQYLFNNGIVAEIIIFRDPGLANMFSSSMDLNKQHLRYVIARYAAYPNVTWSLSNEWQNADYTGSDGQTNWNLLGNCVVSGCNDSGGVRAMEYDPWINGTAGKRALTIHPALKHPSGSGPVVGNCFSFFNQTWPANGSLQYGTSPKTSTAGYESIACNRRPSDTGSCPGGTVNRSIPFTNDEYGYFSTSLSVTQHRNLMWGIVTGGGFGTAGDIRTSTSGCPAGYPSPCGPPIQSTIWSAATQNTDIQTMVNFITGNNIPFWTMSPLDTCPESDGIHTLGVGGTSKKYLVYFDQEGTSPAGQVPAGNYVATWLDPARNLVSFGACTSYPTGAITAPPPVTSCFTPPCDWVVYLTGC